MFQKNMRLKRPLRISPWRKVAIGTWKTVGDPSVYGVADLEVNNALKYLEELQEKTSERLTITHFIGKALAYTLQQTPQVNAVLRWGRIYPRKNIDLFFQVATDLKGHDLSGATVRNADQKSLETIAKELHEKIHSIRKKGDPRFRQTKNIFSWMPGILAWPLIQTLGFFMYGLNLWTKLLGAPKDPFGSVMITNVGPLGLDFAFAPLVPYSRVSILVTVGEIREDIRVENGQIYPTKRCRLCVTFDHRIADGVHASHMMKSLKKAFEDPKACFEEEKNQ